jgi:hypothetical protein
MFRGRRRELELQILRFELGGDRVDHQREAVTRLRPQRQRIDCDAVFVGG